MNWSPYIVSYPLNQDDISRQQEYYQATAATYNERHVSEQDEHALALAVFVAIAQHVRMTGSFLDVGFGTGRAMRILSEAFPEARVEGIEPVAALREQAKSLHGFTDAQIYEGDALNLPFDDNSFDWVVATGVLHHIRDWKRAIREMNRVASYGVLISDSNNIGQGGQRSRQMKKLIKQVGCWNLLVWLQTKGKMSKFSEGDGVYYSFCAFDALPLLSTKFTSINVMNTQGIASADLLGSVSHVAVIARGPIPIQ